ncbi:LysR family transcriptional regulator [Comamonas endophytica]|uniref:LysR family transcriptional regulator n=1 Tax=Comamonas endophytica TaxID=2949090 RepID=A0ABY6GF88_9BURK|nr:MULTISPECIES: LysR family transcriptional regulator [unclassified Acidovorax]MCD2514113.1 LysR family transcriptional regulator [Acidovorax sp. D4N7]UYG53340.1 LysR family transcriptional regulator [Acidovorax sp. 5MLIR]
MRLDPISLRLFIAVMEEQAIARAALREHIATSAASRRLAELELQLNVQLFERSNRGITPTPAAYTLLGLARNVLGEIDGIARQMREYGSGMRGHVRMVANISAITQFLPVQLQGFMAKHPEVQVHLQEKISTEIALAVAQNTADFGILNAGRYGGDLSYLPYRRDELILIAPHGHPLTLLEQVSMRQALEYDFVGAHAGSVINATLTRSAAQLDMPLRLRIQVTSYDALCLMVAAGLGVGILPRQSAALYAGTLGITAVRLDEPWAQRQLVLCLRSLEALPPVARALVEHLIAPPDPVGASEAPGPLQ